MREGNPKDGDAQARRWLALSLDGTDALSDDLIGEGAQLCADAMNARRQLAEAKRGEGTGGFAAMVAKMRGGAERFQAPARADATAKKLNDLGNGRSCVPGASLMRVRGRRRAPVCQSGAQGTRDAASRIHSSTPRILPHRRALD
jgi:hypothetical protein